MESTIAILEVMAVLLLKRMIQTVVAARILPVEHVSRENLPGTAD